MASSGSRPGKKAGLFVLGGVVAFMVAAGLFRQPIAQFLFDPEGYSVAASEVCVTNRDEGELVVEITVYGGAKSVTLLARDERGCSAAPKIGLKGLVLVSRKDGVEPFCRVETVAGQNVEIAAFTPANNCGWQS